MKKYEIKKEDVWKEIEKAKFSPEQAEVLKFICDWVELLFLYEEGKRNKVYTELYEIIKKHRHLSDGTVVNEL